jgi:pimeloyl-ACP methyl ester carboxylesterase
LFGLRGLVLGGLALACTEPAPAVSRLALTPCTLGESGLAANCGSWQVPEDRAQTDGKKITLRVAVVEALAARPAADPLVILVGGPGQAATDAGAAVAEALHRVRRQRDIVLIDQRGTGASQPLNCPAEDDTGLTGQFDGALDVARVRDCLTKLDAAPAQYATPMAMADLDEVRRALGYQQINLWGASYGTRAALHYMQKYPEQVRRVVLDGAVPTDLKLPLFVGRDGQRALEHAYVDCAAQPACAAAFPGARARFAALLQKLEREPQAVTVADPRTGQATTLTISRAGFAAALRSLLYSVELTRLLPLLIERAEHADWGPLVAAATVLSESAGEKPLPLGMFLSVVCAEDVSQITDAEVKQYDPQAFFGVQWLNQLREVCGFWPRAALPPDYFAAVSSEQPTLVLSGGVDPVVPPEWGELVAQRLPNARHVVVNGAAHGVSTLGCMPEVIADFIAGTDVAELDVACAERLQRPAFFTQRVGALPGGTL